MYAYDWMDQERRTVAARVCTGMKILRASRWCVKIRFLDKSDDSAGESRTARKSKEERKLREPGHGVVAIACDTLPYIYAAYSPREAEDETDCAAR